VAILALWRVVVEQRLEVVFAVGYEAADVDVARHLEPHDPVYFDEQWITYYPARGT
jgi:hypothetical protein